MVAMFEFDEKEIDKLARLCRIACTPEEKKALKDQIGGVVKYMDQLKEVDTDGVEPCYSVLENLTNVMREDEVGETLPRELFLGNAPAHTGGMVRVPPVIKTQSP